MNSIDPRFFLDCYERRGLYCPKRRGRLAPVWHKAVRSWRRARRAQDELLRFSTSEELRSCLSSWKATTSTWAMHDVFSAENPLEASSLLLTDASRRAHPAEESSDQAFRAWLRPSDRFSRRILSSIQNPIGLHRCTVETLAHVSAPVDVSFSDEQRIHTTAVTPGDDSRRDDLVDIAWAARGRVFAISEELEHDDVNLEALDESYRRVGLRRYRSIWLAYSLSERRIGRPVGAVVAYRGPLGLDFRFLENRCELLIHPTVSKSSIAALASTLLRVAAPTYDELELDHLPVLADPRTAAVLVEMGARWKENVALAILLRSGYADWCRHLVEVHSRLSSREQRRPAPGPAAVA